MMLFCAVVLPNLEYCCQLWSPVDKGQIRQIEAIQRRFKSKLYGLETLDYWIRLEVLNLDLVERRRERYLIIYVYKIINGIVPNLVNPRFKIRVLHRDRRGRSCIIPPINNRALASVKSLVEMSFPVQAPRLFNSLPVKLRNFNGSTDSFKNLLDNFLKNIPDKPCLPNYHQTASSNSIPDQLDALRSAGIFY